MLNVILLSARTAAEIAEVLKVDPALVRDELGQLHAGQYITRTGDGTGGARYRADLEAIIRKRQARARDLREGAPRPMTLPRSDAGAMLIEHAPETPEAWRVTQVRANGDRTWHSRAISWADAINAALARDGDPRFATDLPLASGEPEPAALPSPASVSAPEAAPVDVAPVPAFWRRVPGGPDRRVRALEEAASLVDSTETTHGAAEAEVEAAKGWGEDYNVDLAEERALATEQDVEGATAIQFALWAEAPAPDDVASLAKFADEKGKTLLAAYLRDAVASLAPEAPSPFMAGVNVEILHGDYRGRTGWISKVPTGAFADRRYVRLHRRSGERTDKDVQVGVDELRLIGAGLPPAPGAAPAPVEQETDEGSENTEPIVVVALDDGTEVFGLDMGPGVPPLGHFYTSQSAAETRAQTLGEGWDVIKRGRRWLVRRLASAGTMPGVAGAAARRGQSIDLGDSVITTTLHPWEGASPPTAARPAKALTFAQVRKMLLAGLDERGWIVKADLKIPHASKDRDRLWFKAQAVYLATGMGKDIGDAHSILLGHAGVRHGRGPPS